MTFYDGAKIPEEELWQGAILNRYIFGDKTSVKFYSTMLL